MYVYHIYLFNVLATFNHLYKMNAAAIKGRLLFKGNIYCMQLRIITVAMIKNPGKIILLEIVVKCNGISFLYLKTCLTICFM